MRSAGRTGRGTAAARLLSTLALVLGLVLGLFAMHGLASTHHLVPAAGAGHPATATADLPLLPQDPADTRQHGHGTPAAAAAAAPRGDAVGPAVPGCSDGGCSSGPVVLCAAVLAGIAVTAWLVAATARRAASVAPAHVGPRLPVPEAARRRRAGPDLVAELCVSRT